VVLLVAAVRMVERLAFTILECRKRLSVIRYPSFGGEEYRTFVIPTETDGNQSVSRVERNKRLHFNQ